MSKEQPQFFIFLIKLTEQLIIEYEIIKTRTNSIKIENLNIILIWLHVEINIMNCDNLM